MSDQPCRSLRIGGVDCFESHGGDEEENQEECVAGGVEGAREGRGTGRREIPIRRLLDLQRIVEAIDNSRKN